MTETGEGRKPTTQRGEDFQSLFEESMKLVRAGGIARGVVVEVTPTHVVVDIGYKSEGQIPVQEFLDAEGKVTVTVGEEIDVYVASTDSESGGVVLSRDRAEDMKGWEKIEKAYEDGTGVEGSIVGKVKGGFRVDVGLVQAFLPASHVDIRPTRNLDKFIGVKDRFAVLKYNRPRRNVVLSRKVLLEKERETLKKDLLKVLEEGHILEGTVRNITNYGAFVDLGGIDGILHISDMSWGRLNHPSEVLKVGDRVKVVVLKFNPERERISLGMKQLLPDPWADVEKKYAAGARVSGKVVSLTAYGAFVELEQGVEGLIHVSEMSWTRKIQHPTKILEVGQPVEVVVLNVDAERRRISLGLKQALPNPWESARAKYPVGSVVKGPIRNITDFGIFVGLEEGIDGLVHVSDLHWTRKIKHPSELYKKGDVVEAKVLGVDVQNERLSLGIKQLAPDPWHAIEERYPVGRRIKGEVTSVPDFGVFIRLEEGIEGLIHVSQLSAERVEKPSAVAKVGEEIEAEVINVDPRERKIGLSIRAMKKSDERKELEEYLKREKEAARFSFESILNEELRLDRDEEEPAGKRKSDNA